MLAWCPPLNSIFDLVGAFGFSVFHEHLKELTLLIKPIVSDLVYGSPCGL